MISAPRCYYLPLVFVVLLLLLQGSSGKPRFPAHFSDHSQQRSNARPEASQGPAQAKSEGGSPISEPNANIRAETIERSAAEPHQGHAGELAIEHGQAHSQDSQTGASGAAIGAQGLGSSDDSALLKQHGGAEFEGAAGHSGHSQINKKAHADGHQEAAGHEGEHQSGHGGGGGGAGRFLAAAKEGAESGVGQVAEQGLGQSQTGKTIHVGQQEAGVQSIAEEAGHGVQYDNVGRALGLPEKTEQSGDQAVGHGLVDPQAGKKINVAGEEQKHKRSEPQQ